MRGVMIAALAVALAAPALEAQAPGESQVGRSVQTTFSVKVGASRLGGGGDVFGLFERELGLGSRAFDSEVLEVEMAVGVLPRVDVFVGGGVRGAGRVQTHGWQGRVGFEDRLQTTQLVVNPGVHVGGRVFAFAREMGRVTRESGGSNVFLSGGVGRGSYSLRQTGDFVDALTDEPFTATFATRDGYVRAFLGLGVEFAVTTALDLTMEAHRNFGSPTPEGDFDRFRTLRLSGSTLSMGVRWHRPQYRR